MVRGHDIQTSLSDEQRVQGRSHRGKAAACNHRAPVHAAARDCSTRAGSFTKASGKGLFASQSVFVVLSCGQGPHAQELSIIMPQILETILPLENHLDVYFGIRAKCITETENVVKIILRSITKQQLVEAGVAHIACRL